MEIELEKLKRQVEVLEQRLYQTSTILVSCWGCLGKSYKDLMQDEYRKCQDENLKVLRNIE